MPLRNFVIIILAAITSLLCYEKATHNRYASTVASAMQMIESNYYEEVDRRELYENAMLGMVSGLDEYSNYIPPRTFLQFRQNIEQEFVGIGIYVDGPPNSDELVVISPVYGTPAYDAGVEAGDVILQIDANSTEGLTLQSAIEQIKGPRGSTVKLKVRRGLDEPEVIELSVKRERIRTPSVLGDTRAESGQWNYSLQEAPEIAYVRITSFGEHTVEELEQVLGDLPVSAKGLIVDLRGNPGGLLRAAVETCDMFLDQGEIVSTRGRRSQDYEQYRAAPGTLVDPQLPVVVMIDHYSASASEIVAACLRDLGRATMAGQRTWGKGTVQNVIPLEGGRSGLKLTTASYWRPNGQNIHRRRDATEEDAWGVQPTSGWELVLDADAYRAMLEERRRRDVLPPGQAEPAEEDEQLELAVKKLRQATGAFVEPAEAAETP